MSHFPLNSDSDKSSLSANPRKILLICGTYPPVLGGSEVEAQRVSKALIQRGHQVEVLCAAHAIMPPQDRWTDPCGVPVRILGWGWTGRMLDVIFALNVAWILLRERKNYEVAYFLMQGLHLAAGLLACRLLGKPTVMKISSNTIIPTMQRSFMGRLELGWLRRWAKRVMILNETMREEAQAADFHKEQLLWMPNPVDVDVFCPAPATNIREQLRADRGFDGVTILYVGRLAPEKNLATLLRAFAQAKLAVNAQLVLLGDGPERESLKTLHSSLGLGTRVRFAGRVSSDEVVEWLQASDIFALVSQREGFPCSLTEAMAVGLPALVSDIPGTRQLIEHGRQGFLAPSGDPSTMARSLERLCEDVDLRQRMGTSARQLIVANYSTGKVAERYESMFAEALA
jgi:glycosyltransferase involved in cell wall biosynthesis